jgi:hypothetical protein
MRCCSGPTGHSSIQLTLDTYSHLMPDLKLKELAAARLDALLKQQPEEDSGQNSGQNCGKVVSPEESSPLAAAEGCRRVPDEFRVKPTRTEWEVVSRIFASWNQMAAWLRQIAGVRAAAWAGVPLAATLPQSGAKEFWPWRGYDLAAALPAIR